MFCCALFPLLDIYVQMTFFGLILTRCILPVKECIFKTCLQMSGLRVSRKIHFWCKVVFFTRHNILGYYWYKKIISIIQRYCIYPYNNILFKIVKLHPRIDSFSLLILLYSSCALKNYLQFPKLLFQNFMRDEFFKCNLILINIH